MNKLLSAFFITAIVACALPAMAATPLIFRQTELTIIAYGPAPDAAVPAKEEDGEPASATPQQPPAPRVFKIRAQSRPASVLQQQDLFSIDPFVHSQAHLFLFEPPTLTAFRAPSIQKPVDLIAVDANGIIVEIVPKAVPATLDPNQYAVEQPVRALLLLPAGTVDANGLRPGDKVQNALFNQPPEKRR